MKVVRKNQIPGTKRHGWNSPSILKPKRLAHTDRPDTVHKMFPFVNHQVLPSLQPVEQEVASPGGKFV